MENSVVKIARHLAVSGLRLDVAAAATAEQRGADRWEPRIVRERRGLASGLHITGTVSPTGAIHHLLCLGAWLCWAFLQGARSHRESVCANLWLRGAAHMSARGDPRECSLSAVFPQSHTRCAAIASVGTSSIILQDSGKSISALVSRSPAASLSHSFSQLFPRRADCRLRDGWACQPRWAHQY